MIDVKSLKTETLRDLASVIKEELDSRKQEQIDKAIEEFKQAFNKLRELDAEIVYFDDWDDNCVSLQDWNRFSFK